MWRDVWCVAETIDWPLPKEIRSAWTQTSFLEIWCNYLLKREDEPHSSFISHQIFCIFDLLGESLMSFIIVHCDYYPEVPLLTCKRGTEACQHIFSCMRVILPNFTILDTTEIMPKVYAVLKSVMSGNMKFPPLLISMQVSSPSWTACKVW